MNHDRQYLIGIDPSFKTMGVAVYNPRTKQYWLGGGDMSQGIRDISQWAAEGICILEDPNGDKAVYGAAEAIQEASERYRVGGKEWNRKVRTALKIAQDVGANKAAARELMKWMDRFKIPYMLVAPSDRDRADKTSEGRDRKCKIEFLRAPTKTTSEQFRKLTGHHGTSNEHQRDAATLCWGRSISWALAQITMREEMNSLKKSAKLSNHQNHTK